MKKMRNKIIQMSLIASALIFTGCYFPTSIDSGEVGVVKSWGEVQPSIKQAGLTFSLIPGDDLYIMRTTNKQAVFSYNQIDETKAVKDTTYGNGISVITASEEGMGVTVPLDISCLYQLDPKMAATMMAKYGEDGVWDNKLVVRLVRSTVRDQIGQTSLDKLNINRVQYEEKIRTALNNQLASYGVIVTTFNIQNIGVPQSIQDSVLAKEQAKQNAEKAKFQVLQANAEAEVEVAKATGIAKANSILTSSLTDKLVQYKQLEIQRIIAEKYKGDMPSTIVTGGDSKLILPIPGSK